MIQNLFDRSGLASLDDLSSPCWRGLFQHLELIQEEFLAVQPHSADYPWTKDPLHNCIRVWEYPFVHHHLHREREELSNSIPQVVDLGSGATFFPFAVARLGWRCTAVDADPAAKASMQSAIRKLTPGSGAVTFLQSDARSIALKTNSVDCVYCVSVLEHIPDFESVIYEVARILRPNGLLVLTFDVDLRGNSELGPAAYERLMMALQASFFPIHPEKTIHPLRLLTTDNSIYPMYPCRPIIDRIPTPIVRALHSAYDRLRNRPLSPGRLLASTYGICMRKRGVTASHAFDRNDFLANNPS